MDLATINYLLALGTIAMQIASVVLIALLLLRKRVPDLAAHAAFVGRWAVPVAFAAALGASSMALVHQYVFGLPPCELCWWQRIFLYPQVLLFAFALRAREWWMTTYALILSVIGLGIALYHHALQMMPAGALPCPSQGVSCAQILFLEFGYITYPMMSASLFVFIIILMLFARLERN